MMDVEDERNHMCAAFGLRDRIDYHLPRWTYLADQFPRTLCDPTPQNLVPIFRDPDDVVFEVKSRVCGMPVFSQQRQVRRQQAA